MKVEELLNNIQEFFNQNPKYVYLVGAIILLFVSIGNFKKWNWAITPSGYRQRWWYNLLGEKYFSTIMGIVFFVGSIACFIGFYISLN